MSALVNVAGRPVALNRVAAGLAFLFVVCIPLLAANFQTVRDPYGEPLAGDFPHEYMGGYIVLHGDHQRFYNPEYAYTIQHDPVVMGMTYSADRFLPMIYPPFYYLLVAPLTLLSCHAAAVVWLFLMAGCLGLTVWLLSRAFPEHPALPTWALAGALFFVPVLQSLHTSQKGTLILLILTATFVLLNRRRPFWAGVIFGLIAFKPHLALVIALAMLCKRQWWFVLGGAITGVVLVGLSLLTSVDACNQYLHLSGTMADYINIEGYPLEKLHCWYGFWKLLLPEQDMIAVRIATLLAGGITVAVLAWQLKGPLAYGGPQFAMQFAGLVVATVLLSPNLLTYDLTILLLPFFLLTHVLLTQSSLFAGRQKWVIWILVLLYVGAGLSSLMAQWIHLQMSVPLLFALLATLTRVPKDGKTEENLSFNLTVPIVQPRFQCQASHATNAAT